jgi:CubicO group peptidase (beta-lactamase class C family)
LAQAGGSAPAAPAVQTDLAGCYEVQASLVPFSGVLLVDRRGETFVRAAGTMDSEQRVPITRSTRFRLASVQKVLTRVAIGRLVDRGLIELDAPVGRYVQGLPSGMAAATIDQLLQHRSGVPSFTRVAPDVMQTLMSATNARELVDLVARHPLAFQPGEREEYSNGGYWLLGAAIEATSGMEYGAYLEEAVFRPLGMTSTSLVTDAQTAVRRTRMLPGQPPLPEPRPVAMPREPRGNASGDGVTTADDLMRLGRALVGDSLLRPGTKARLFPRSSGEPWRLGQSGGNIGTNTDFAVYPENGVVSVALSNFDPPAGELMGRVMRQAALAEGCTPLREEDARGPRRMMPPGASPGPGTRGNP